jgi:transcriptional regulator with XRE-family HTH domain
MNKNKRAELETRGYFVGNADEFLGLEPYESAIVGLRLSISQGIKAAREKNRKTQQEIARAMNSTQNRVALAEAGSTQVSIELMIRALYAAGGSLPGIGIGRKSAAKSPADRVTASPTPAKARARAKGSKLIEA